MTTSTQDYSKIGFIHIAAMGLADQVIPYTNAWHPWVTAANYLVEIATVVYMAFQAQPAVMSERQLASAMDHARNHAFKEPWQFQPDRPLATQPRNSIPQHFLYLMGWRIQSQIEKILGQCTQHHRHGIALEKLKLYEALGDELIKHAESSNKNRMGAPTKYFNQRINSPLV
ncbi:hypothetical protein DSO57_1033280 [Entomophthora muscae]|uniref:Uncharacterized protein n=1 Tax=Entomophthora muscae TaxID=34485 RepID=A0ACC2UKZ7_9FUNG|nr:hypothetical protein DSO57_1033280 [Entomophthora muscae]